MPLGPWRFFFEGASLKLMLPTSQKSPGPCSWMSESPWPTFRAGVFGAHAHLPAQGGRATHRRGLSHRRSSLMNAAALVGAQSQPTAVHLVYYTSACWCWMWHWI